jgi:DNA (cytosine-5)-methyltransferase 1
MKRQKSANTDYLAVDLFAGCGGLSEGMRQAGFKVFAALEVDREALRCYSLNHLDTYLINEDIRSVKTSCISVLLKGKTIHLLAGCPPCQGFSSVRRLNRTRAVRDNRNKLVLDYLRFIRDLGPLTVMLENVPGVKKYYLFNYIVQTLIRLGYQLDYNVVDLADYGVPQKRKRLILVGSLLGPINIASPTEVRTFVRDWIGDLEPVHRTIDPMHKIVANHSPRIQKLIKKIPKDGGSRTDLSKELQLQCHLKPNVGFNDIYGRLKWDSYSSTITAGCLNPSKGRFLHPVEDRVITPREAALLQTFPRNYRFPTDISKAQIASLIGNALPPLFSRIQTSHILKHIIQNRG